MRSSGIVTLLTDFDYIDGFVGSMKGVILSINPDARLVDISHAIPPQDVDAAAFVLHTSFRCFPDGTVHVVVVDPGVGSARKAIAVEAAGHLFVAPDNGVLKYIFDQVPDASVRLLANNQYVLPHVSATFHGRDVFAPVAAHLSRGLPVEELGPPFGEFIRGRLQWPKVGSQAISGQVLHIDRFGNAITNISQDLLREAVRDSTPTIIIGKAKVTPISTCYDDARSGQPVAVWGSSGYLEIAVKGGSASVQLGVNRNQQIRITW